MSLPSVKGELLACCKFPETTVKLTPEYLNITTPEPPPPPVPANLPCGIIVAESKGSAHSIIS